MMHNESWNDWAKEGAESFHFRLKKAFESGEAPENGELCRLLLSIFRTNSPEESRFLLVEVVDWICRYRNRQAGANLLMRLEVCLGYRKPKVAIYDNAFHFIGGAQKYGCTIASALQNDFEVTLIANSDISKERLESWYDLDLSLCRLKIIRIPYFDQLEFKTEVYDAGLVDLRKENPFHLISLESGGYDIFVNNCMLEMVFPLANISEFVCHFPERERSRFFHVDKYTHIIYNSRYTAGWIKKRWNLDPHVHLYPPVDMAPAAPEFRKENIILSVSRFELSGNKQQLEMVKAFSEMNRLYSRPLQNWRLVLAGGSTSENPYLDRIRHFIESVSPDRIELKVNLSARELKEIYRRARIFWHFSGWDQTDPAKIEHFGMTTVEAMQNACIPVVFKGGGQEEIVEEGISGFLFRDKKELFNKTLQLIENEHKIEPMSDGVMNRGGYFTRSVFADKAVRHFQGLLSGYTFQSDTVDESLADS